MGSLGMSGLERGKETASYLTREARMLLTAYRGGDWYASADSSREIKKFQDASGQGR